MPAALPLLIPLPFRSLARPNAHCRTAIGAATRRTSSRRTEPSRSSLLPSVSSPFSPLSPAHFPTRFSAFQCLSRVLRRGVHGAATNHRRNCFLRPRKDWERARLDLLSLPVFLVRKTVPRSLLTPNAGELRGRRPWHAPHRRTPGHALGMGGLATVSSFSRFKRNRKPCTVAPYSLAPVSFGRLAMVMPLCTASPPPALTIPSLSLIFFIFIPFF